MGCFKHSHSSFNIQTQANTAAYNGLGLCLVHFSAINYFRKQEWPQKDQNVKNQVIFDETTHNVKVKFASKWFDGQIVGSGESKKMAEEVLVQLEEKLIKGSGKIL